jgi:hypothetical protein
MSKYLISRVKQVNISQLILIINALTIASTTTSRDVNSDKITGTLLDFAEVTEATALILVDHSHCDLP